MGLTKRIGLLAAVAAVCVAAAGAGSHSTAAGAPAKARNLVQFRSCGDLLGYAKSQANRLVGPWGLGGGPPPPPGVAVTAVASAAAAETSTRRQGVDFSGTNVQEQGVDEPDLVKTNGATLFAFANGRVNAVDVGGSRPRLLDTLALDGVFDAELLLHGRRLLVLSRAGAWIEPRPGLAASIAPYLPARSVLTEVDVSDPKALKVVRTLTLDGSYLEARLIEGTARIVTAAQVPSELPFQPATAGEPASLAAAEQRNRDVVAASRVGSWLPKYTLGRTGRAGAVERPLVQCRHVSHPRSFSGLGMLTVLTVDLDKGLEPVDSVAVMTDARIVYASTRNLYLATEKWAERPTAGAPFRAKDEVTTEIHRFDISSPARAAYRGSGSVSGFLLNQWSLSEDRGVLRVVSTESPAWWGTTSESESFLTTLRQRDGGLVQAGRVGELGKGERVYAVRFVGDVGYVVTFRQIDPLYTLDLADAEHPRVLGELKIEGYSAYLHPIGEDLLLGVGQDASETGQRLGTQVSVFDVSNLRRPARLDRATLGGGFSEAEWDHHAFLFWPRTGLVVIPYLERAHAFRVGRARGVADAGPITHPAGKAWAPIRRALVVGDSVLTVSSAGVASNRLNTLAAEGWTAFPAPPPAPASR